jgi:DNA-binding beta-propeller fold protein YncE
VNTGTYTLGLPTAARIDFGGNIYIADAGSTPRIIEVPGETYASYTPSLLNLGSQSVSFPQALAVDNAGANLYVGDGNLNQVLQVSLSGWRRLAGGHCALRFYRHHLRAQLACRHCL